MSSSALTWAMSVDTGYPSCKLALIMMAEQSHGGEYEDVWVGTEEDLARSCLMDDLEASWTLWALEDMGLIRRCVDSAGTRAWRLNVDRVLDVAALLPRARLARSNHGAKIPKERRQRIYERDEYRCVRCGSTEDLTLDHIKPRKHGGSNTEENLQTMCRSCNCSKGARV